MWDSLWFVRLFRSGPVWLVHVFSRVITLIFLNRFVLWCAPERSRGKQSKQYRLIHKQAPASKMGNGLRPCWQAASQSQPACDSIVVAAYSCLVLGWVSAFELALSCTCSMAAPLASLCRFGGGVPCKQYRLIHKDGVKIAAYVGRTLDGVARNSHLGSDNYFYFNCLTGALAADCAASAASGLTCCPA